MVPTIPNTMQPKQLLKIAIPLLGGLLLCILIAFFFSLIVPYNMDEFSAYHPIICHHYPENKHNIFRENCKQYDLEIFGTNLILPLRSYYYIGSFAAIIYYPLFLIFKSPLSSRLLGIIALAISGFLLGKMFNIRHRVIMLFLLMFFPYFFGHATGTGDLVFTTTSIFLIYLLATAWFSKVQARYPLLIALIIFGGVWAKLTYFWLVPGIGLMLTERYYTAKALWQNSKHRVKNNIKTKTLIKKIIMQGLCAGIICAALIGVLLFSKSPLSGQPYIQSALAGKGAVMSKEVSARALWNHGVMKTLRNPLEATHRIFFVKSNMITKMYGLAMMLFVPAAITMLLTLGKIPWRACRAAILYFIAFAASIGIMLFTPGSWAAHHALLAYPFLIISIFLTVGLLQKVHNVSAILFGVFIIANVYLFFSFPFQNIRPHDDWSKIKINRILNDDYLASKYFYVVVDWGMYYYQGLYGPHKQSVLYLEPLTAPAQITQLKRLSKLHDRKLLFIYMNPSQSNLHLIFQSTPLKRCRLADAAGIWQITLEPDENPKNRCMD